MDTTQKLPELEACGWYVRVKRTAAEPHGWLVADCSTAPHGKDYARLFAAAPTLLTAARQALALISGMPHRDSCFVPDDICKCGKDAAIAALDEAINLAKCAPDPVAEPVRHFRACGEGL